MSDRWLIVIAAPSVLGAALVAGTFFAFSTFVMRGLAALPARQGIAAMQSINVTVISPWFMGALFGTAALSVAAAVLAVIRWGQPGSPALLARAALYLVLSIGVTVAGNVPLNDTLAATDPDGTGAAAVWDHFALVWTRWNHVRTAGAAAAMAAFVVAIVQQARSAV